MDPFLKDLSDHNWTEEIRLNESLSNKTSVRVGGSARYFQTVFGEYELKTLLKLVRRHKVSLFVLGKGTNLLVHDEGFSGIIVQLSGDFTQITQTSQGRIICGAGLSNKKLSRFAREQELSGVEFLLTIPGSVGGAIFMNAGAHGDQICDTIEWVEAFNKRGKLIRYSQKSAHFSYRTSVFMKEKLIVSSICFQLKPSVFQEIEAREKNLLLLRKSTQPINLKTWGSVFMNPPGDSAGRLIEACGLKGKGFGKARISTKHANFIENSGGASYKDLTDTIEMAKSKVLEKFGIELKTEGQVLPEN